MLVLALALMFADPGPADSGAAATAPAPAPAAAEAPWPVGAPRDDYQLVAWCYGALRGYLDLHDQVMPEVTRIEAEFRKPGSRLEDDLKVYADQQAQARGDLKRFRTALTAAEKASLKPINALGAEAVAKGRAIWNMAPDTPKAHVAQEWMSWTLPARCPATAEALEQRARLMGPAFKVNVDGAPAPAPAEKPAEAAPADKPAPGA